MNLRAIMLLTPALLMQMGQGFALGGASDRVEGHSAACDYGCCAALEVCPCAAAPVSDPTPQTPVPLPVSGREQVPQPVMTEAAASDFMALSTRASDDLMFHPAAPRMIAESAVPLTVLHCAFLI